MRKRCFLRISLRGALKERFSHKIAISADDNFYKEVTGNHAVLNALKNAESNSPHYLRRK